MISNRSLCLSRCQVYGQRIPGTLWVCACLPFDHHQDIHPPSVVTDALGFVSNLWRKIHFVLLSLPRCSSHCRWWLSTPCWKYDLPTQYKISSVHVYNEGRSRPLNSRINRKHFPDSTIQNWTKLKNQERFNRDYQSKPYQDKKLNLSQCHSVFHLWDTICRFYSPSYSPGHQLSSFKCFFLAAKSKLYHDQGYVKYAQRMYEGKTNIWLFQK